MICHCTVVYMVTKEPYLTDQNHYGNIDVTGILLRRDWKKKKYIEKEKQINFNF